MDLKKILHSLENCPCGRKHTFVTEVAEIGHGVKERAGKILADAGFPKKVIVSDDNAMRAADGLLPVLEAAGFEMKKLVYKNMMYAKIEQVREVEALLGDVDGVIAVGTGSVDDICRVASFNKKKKFAIFATAPSMDGFASDSAPIIENNFKGNLTTADICKKTGCYQKNLSHHFKKTMNMSIINYIERTRALEAARLLNTNPKMTVETVMLESGFKSNRSFLRHFKNIYGCTPTEYKNRQNSHLTDAESQKGPQ